MILEKENINADEFFRIAFAFLDYGFFHLFIDFTIHHQEFLSEEINKLHKKSSLHKDSYINEIIEKIMELKKKNKLFL